MAKIKREEFQNFINATPSSTATYEVIGSDLEEFVKELNMEVETTTNILGSSSIKVTKGNATASVEPYYANTDEDMFTFLKTAIDNGSELDDLKTDVVQVKLYEIESAGEYPAIKEDVYVELVSEGGDTTGYQIPYNIHYTGVKTTGTFNPTTKTFTPA